MAQDFCLIVVPLRLRSVRLPEKILKPLGGKSLATQVLDKLLTELGERKDVRIIAAVDDSRTEALLKKELGSKLEVLMTDPELPSGTDRVFAAFLDFQKKHPELPAPVGVINVQGDMPHLDGRALVPVVEYYLAATPVEREETPIFTLSQDWPSDCEFDDIAHVKVISDRARRAIYFSRLAIPYTRVPLKEARTMPEFASYEPELHIGVYGYTPKALAEFCSHGPIALEKFEMLEQLRALWLGKKILVLKCDVPADRSFRGVDTPADFKWALGFPKKQISKKPVRAKNTAKAKTKKSTKKVAKKTAKKKGRSKK